jgi:hypothetical protein
MIKRMIAMPNSSGASEPSVFRVRPSVQAAFMAAALWILPSGTARASGRPVLERSPIVIQDDTLEVQIDRDSGLLRRVLDMIGKIEVCNQPQSAESFRLILDESEIRSCHQTLGGTEPISGGVRLIWPGPLQDEQGVRHPIEARLEVSVAAGELTFRLGLRNHSARRIRQVMYPFIGGINALAPTGGPGGARLAVPSGAVFKESELPLKEQSFVYPQNMAMAFVDVNGLPGGRSLYFACHDQAARAKLFRAVECVSGGARDMALCWVHQPFTPPGGEFAGSKVVLRFHDSDWRNGARIYRHWFQKQFGIADPMGNWIRRDSVILDTMFMLPEGNINFTFKDIPKWAREAWKYGIRSLLISGWNCGGHDSGYPQYTPDPRLGSWEDLRAGIKEIHALGMKVYFFVNFQPIDVTSAWYERELRNYAVRDLKGQTRIMGGWGMGTLEARLGKFKPNGFADLSIPQYRKILVGYFKRLAELGADGLHIDKMYIWNPLSFNPLSKVSPDQAECEGALQLTEETLSECRAINPGFAVSFETSWDRVLSYTGAVWWVGTMDCARWAFPEMAPTIAITQPYDFLGVNSAVRQGQCILLGPGFYTRSMDWEPWRPLSRYIGEVKRIRDEFNETAYWGEPGDPRAIRWESPLAAGLQASLWRNRRSGLSACLLTNSTMKEQEATLTGLGEESGKKIRIRIPFQPDQTGRLPWRVKIPAERIAFLVEDDEPDPLVVQNAYLFVSVDPLNGTINRIYDKVGKLELIAEKRLADNYKFTLPLPGKELWQSSEGNLIVGRAQSLSRSESGPDRLILHWDAPLKNERGVSFDVAAVMELELKGPALIFRFQLQNRGPLGIGEVYYPILAGLRGLGQDPEDQVRTLLRLPGKKGPFDLDIFRVFTGQNELGSAGPEQSYESPWVDLVQLRLKRSVRLDVLDPGDRRPRRVYLELWPGVAGLRQDGNWPRAEELEGQPVGVRLSFVQILNTPQGQGFTAPPVRLEFK